MRNLQNDSFNAHIVLKKYSTRTLQDIVKETILEIHLARKDSLLLVRFSQALCRNDEKYFCYILKYIFNDVQNQERYKSYWGME